ncbi:MAG: metallophosphoesterase [Phycisphaerales bacterium]|nr:MAG: metallophosphoesterase [Phycisphaerales bacterium]
MGCPVENASTRSIVLSARRQRLASAFVLACLVTLAAGVPAVAQTVSFVVTGDSRGADNGVNTTILSEIVHAVLAENDVDFLLFSGDLVNGSSDPDVLKSQLTTWRDVVQPLYDAGIGVYPCRGNHDAANKVAWDAVFSGGYALPANGPAAEANVTFSFCRSHVCVIALDQYVRSHRVNQTWLDARLALNISPHLFILGHEPAFKVSHWDTLDDYPLERDTFWNSIAVAGVRAYFCGHDHFYDHCRLDDGDGDPNNDLHQYIAGTAGAHLYGDELYDGENGSWTPRLVLHDQQYGYLLAEIEDLTATLTWKHRTGPGVYECTNDVFTYSVSPCENNEACDDGDACTGTKTCQANGVCARDLVTDCNENWIEDYCELDDGTAQDCNGNLILDRCDIADETSNDCNANVIPDECDLDFFGGSSPDCNTNWVPDECDIFYGISGDCNENGIPDECDILYGISGDCNENGIPDECDRIGAGDFNSDRVVDLRDSVALVDCMTGPDAAVSPASPACSNACLDAFDFDSDGDVDMGDVAGLQQAFGTVYEAFVTTIDSLGSPITLPEGPRTPVQNVKGMPNRPPGADIKEFPRQRVPLGSVASSSSDKSVRQH